MGTPKRIHSCRPHHINRWLHMRREMRLYGAVLLSPTTSSPLLVALRALEHICRPLDTTASFRLPDVIHLMTCDVADECAAVHRAAAATDDGAALVDMAGRENSASVDEEAPLAPASMLHDSAGARSRLRAAVGV